MVFGNLFNSNTWKYIININPKTFKYYYDGNNDKPQNEPIQQQPQREPQPQQPQEEQQQDEQPQEEPQQQQQPQEEPQQQQPQQEPQQQQPQQEPQQQQPQEEQQDEPESPASDGINDNLISTLLTHNDINDDERQSIQTYLDKHQKIRTNRRRC